MEDKKLPQTNTNIKQKRNKNDKKLSKLFIALTTLLTLFILLVSSWFSMAFPPILQHTYGGSNFIDEAYDIAVDLAGNVHLTGRTYGGQTDDLTYAKFAPNGNIICYRVVQTIYNNTPRGDIGYAITVDANGSAYLTGVSYGPPAGNDIFVLKFDGNCNLVWSKVYGLSNDEEARDITIDPNDGYLVIVGSTTFPNSPNNQPDGFIAKIRPSDGQLINPIRLLRGNLTDITVGVSADSSGIYVAGYTNSFGARQGFIAKFNSQLQPIWAKLWPQNPGDKFYAFHSVTVSGEYLFAAGEGDSPTQNNRDAVLVRINKTTGDQIWAVFWGDPEGPHDAAYGVTIDSIGIYIAGIAKGTVMQSAPHIFADQSPNNDNYGFIAAFDFTGGHMQSEEYKLGLANKNGIGFYKAITYHERRIYVAGASEQYPIPDVSVSPILFKDGARNLTRVILDPLGEFGSINVKVNVLSPTPVLDNPPIQHAAYLVAQKWQPTTTTTQTTTTTTTAPPPSECGCVLDLSTGSTNFTAKNPGEFEDPVNKPFDWTIRLPNGSLTTAWVVSPLTGTWYSGYPVGTKAMWITPYKTANNYPDGTAPPLNANFTYSIVFVTPAAGNIYLRATVDDYAWFYLDNNFFYNITPTDAYTKLWPQPQNPPTTNNWLIIPVSQGMHNLTVIVRNWIFYTGLLVEAFFCSPAITTTLTNITTITTTTTTTATTTSITTTTTTLPPTTITTTTTYTTTLSTIIVDPWLEYKLEIVIGLLIAIIILLWWLFWKKLLVLLKPK